MKRRNFLKCCSYAIPSALIFNNNISIPKTGSKKGFIYEDDYIKKIADTVIRAANSLGATYTDFRLTYFLSQNVSTREQTVQSISENENLGFSVRVIIDETWGFAASSTFTENEAVRITKIACELAKAGKTVNKNPVILSPNPIYNDYWKTPIQKSSFDVPVNEKVEFLLEINRRAKELGSSYCSSFIWSVNEKKHFISSEGSYIRQDIHRIWPSFEVTVVDRETGDFQSLDSSTEPMGMG
ncbi:MAG: TldD/PmbA family protein, partial [Ignavibacteria bacterium]|nr:TldD/PmbA family protein [Ignavibacteria bacterium]